MSYHDSKNLDVVYMVSPVPLNNRRAMRRQIKKQKAMIRAVLDRLRRGQKPRTGFEKKIASSIPRRVRGPRFFQKARHQIRCQRGVATDFRLSLKRSKKYLPMIKKNMAKYNVPKDLAYSTSLRKWV